MTRRPPTLFSRLLILTLPVESIILVLFGVWLIRGIERKELVAFDGSLKAQSKELLGGVTLDPAGKLEVDVNPHAVAPGTSACLLDGGGRILWELPKGWFKASGLRATSHEAFESVQSVRSMGARYRVFDETQRMRTAGDTDPYVATGPLVEVVLAGSLSGLGRSSLELREKAAGVGIALLALTGVLLWAAIKAGLSPASALMRRMQDIPGPAGTERLDEGLVPSELRPLAREINHLLDRLWGLIELEKRFTAEAAHEFRTPLTIVKSTLQTALLTAGSREDHEGALREALEDLQRLEKTAESLLTLARADALLSGPAPTFEDISLPALLKSIAERFAPAARDRAIELALDLHPCRVRGNAAALERLFVNLIDNAVKYSNPSGRITVQCAPDEGYTLAAVADGGPPIPEDEQAHLFQQFFRGTAGRAAQSAGAGLGLSIAAAMARLHHAELTYERWNREGNRFVVKFPAADKS